MVFNLLSRLNKLNKVLGINHRNHSLVHPYNPKEFHNLANNKALCKEILIKNGIPTPETYAVIHRLGEVKAKLKSVQHHDAIAVKPARGSGGGGILILKKNRLGQWTKPSGRVISEKELYLHIANILYGMYSKQNTDEVIIEYCLDPHDFFTEIYANGVPDFRIIICKGIPILAMLRLPTDDSDGKANLHAGAIGVGIDLEDGKILSGFDGEKYIARHPNSRVRFLGKKIPDWEKTMEIALQTDRAFPLDYLGIDIIFDRQLGPMVIEINVRPGIQIQNVHRKGLAELMREHDLL